MNHLSEEQIVLHYYGDAEGEEEVREHLAQCSECRREFERVQGLLRSIEPTEVPEPPAVFEEKTWLNVRDRLPQRRGGLRQWLIRPPKWVLAGAMAVLLAAAFTAGRFWPKHEAGNPPNNAAANPQRVVLIAVGGHLERSQMLLVEIMNADGNGATDLTTEQQQARDLLEANRLYRESAQRTGDPAITRTLDELERVLVEVANGPSEVSDQELDSLRKQIEAQGLLFKIRVIGSKVRQPAKTNDPNTEKL